MIANLSSTPNPGTTGVSDVTYNIGFMGMYRDQESGLAQNWNRYFDKRLGRYTQPDRIGLDGGPNRYPYANLNPLRYADPDGRLAFLLPAAPTIGGWIAGGVGTATGAMLGWNVFGPMLQDKTPNMVSPAHGTSTLVAGRSASTAPMASRKWTSTGIMITDKVRRMVTIGALADATRVGPCHLGPAAENHATRGANMSRFVMLVLQSDSQLFVRRIAREVPVWIADTQANAQIKASSTGDPEQMTWFPLRAGESLEQAAARIAVSLDDHYNEHSQQPGYDTLVVQGVDAAAMPMDIFKDLGFVDFEESRFGLVASK
ncbi:RHS repeat-associated core domain-containing protein [Variovorax sp. DT-64]|uniref:RHS repeat-associated core domain-containing protein n=1 Tax=Variovorax sp. DT-64 TaxID=3396160 RepID=UPI003F1DA28C